MLSLTKQERQVILFLSALALLGLGARFVSKKYSRVKLAAGFCRVLNKPDINAADGKLLESVPGIGPVLAKRIIDYRRQRGGIGDVDELLDIKGISPGKLEKIKEAFVVGK